MNIHSEILLIDKPKGITSFDVVYKVRRKLNPKPEVGNPARKDWVCLRVGHAGTLDPLATGLMIIGVGKGTKKLTELTKLDKEYIAEVRIGEKRTTGDLEGEIVEEKSVTTDDISLEEISSVIASLVGTHRLPVSAYSAIKKDGKPMYKRAREAEKKGGVITDVPMRDMTVYEAEVLKVETIAINRDSGEILNNGFPIIDDREKDEGVKRLVVTVRFSVASGVYVRSLGEELGKRLGYPATLQNLRRTKVGEFDVKDALSISCFE